MSRQHNSFVYIPVHLSDFPWLWQQRLQSSGEIKQKSLLLQQQNVLSFQIQIPCICIYPYCTLKVLLLCVMLFFFFCFIKPHFTVLCTLYAHTLLLDSQKYGFCQFKILGDFFFFFYSADWYKEDLLLATSKWMPRIQFRVKLLTLWEWNPQTLLGKKKQYIPLPHMVLHPDTVCVSPFTLTALFNTSISTNSPTTVAAVEIPWGARLW